MAPKTRTTSTDQNLEETLRTINQRLKKVNMLDNIDNKIESLNEKFDKVDQRITALESDSVNKDKRITQLEGTVTNLHTELQITTNNFEQQLHSNDIIISGLKTHHKSFATATSNNPLQQNDAAPGSERDRLKSEVLAYFLQHNIAISHDAIVKCHTIGKLTPMRPQRILIQFSNTDEKSKLLEKAKLLGKSNPVYVNDYLTKENSRLFYEARKLKKSNKIQGAWTRNGKVLIRATKNGSTFVKEIRSDHDLRSVLPPIIPDGLNSQPRNP